MAALAAGRDPAVIRGLLMIAQSLRLDIVAEGVETDQQLRQLRDLGCDLGQGYLMNRPLPAAGAAASFREAGPAVQAVPAPVREPFTIGEVA